MKYFLHVLIFLFTITLNAQNECSPLVPVTVGSKWEITNYSAKGKEEGKTSYELLEKKETDSGMVFVIKSTAYDKKGEVTYDDQFQALCQDGKYKIDMSFRMSGMGMQNYEGMDIDMKSTNLEFPDMDAPAGTQLKDASLTVNVSTNAMAIMNMVVEITERKIEASESKETPAGKFDCLVLYQKTSMKSVMKSETYSREWYAKEIGMVRSEVYNKNGKLMGYSELTMLEIQ